MASHSSKSADETAPVSASTPLLRKELPNHAEPSRQNVLYRVAHEAWHASKATLTYSFSNVLLVCVPLGIMAAQQGWSPAAVFTLNFLAMLPLASILTFSTEQLAAEFGSVIGGLINATFGNAVEMIV